MSRWFVGSSRRSSSGDWSSAAARATRFLSPPDSPAASRWSRCSTLSLEHSLRISNSRPHASSASIAAIARASCSAAASSSGAASTAACASWYCRSAATPGAGELKMKLAALVSGGREGSCST
mmetsp:Transcript_37285/g.92748  ORF Transcript_37285/g.92748 Transcript_37285/m.92748 type:complete len:123 (-) Transcript_37285:218-586(-)